MSDKSVLLVKEKNIATVTLNIPSANNSIDLNIVKYLY